ncbi:MAG: cytochrome c oxidase subunit 4 [Ornithinimicrobium sp.]|jgi:hypothetical protein|uniref:cytochrome c oxidase subunit 4 n=1 Tax=Ornithinimicrobium sp. TaxID=1977084 RepID=UPI003D9AC512
MKSEARLFGFLVPFCIMAAMAYTYFTGGKEWVGIVGITLVAALSGFIAFYLWLVSRKLDPRPEDRLDGEIAEQAGDYGFFSPYSWWPLWLGLSCAALFLGVAIGWWMVIISAPLVALATVGWTFEYFRGEKAV